MSAADVFVTATQAVQVLQPFNKAGTVVITNNGPAEVYLDDQTTVSAFSNDYVLKAGATVEWQAGLACWALAGSLGVSASLGIANNVRAFTSPALGGSGAQVGTVIYNGPPDALQLVNALDCRAYQSIRIICNTPYIPGVSGGSYLCQWVNEQSVAPQGIRQDVMIPNPTNVAMQWDWTLDVAGPYFAMFQQGTMNAPAAKVTIIGYSNRMPLLMYEPYNPNGGISPKLGPTLFSEGPFAVGVSGTAYALPVWSGKIDINIFLAIVGAVTLTPLLILYDTILGTNFRRATLPPTQQNAGSAGWNVGINGAVGGRRPMSYFVQTGTGYTNMQLNHRVVFYGSEDN